MNKLDLSGRRFGLLTAVKSVQVGRDAGWECLCDCGATSAVVTGSLTAGKSRSCGCLRKEVSRKKSTIRGLTGHPLLEVYKNMVRRCYCPTATYYKNYGGRGIKVSPLWRNNPEAFFTFALQAGWSRSLTIDRIDNDGDYTPNNCRFVTRAENNRNRPRTPCTNTSGFLGVSQDRKSGKYKAYAKRCHIGYFHTAVEAAEAREAYCLEHQTV